MYKFEALVTLSAPADSKFELVWSDGVYRGVWMDIMDSRKTLIHRMDGRTLSHDLDLLNWEFV